MKESTYKLAQLAFKGVISASCIALVALHTYSIFNKQRYEIVSMALEEGQVRYRMIDRNKWSKEVDGILYANIYNTLINSIYYESVIEEEAVVDEVMRRCSRREQIIFIQRYLLLKKSEYHRVDENIVRKNVINSVWTDDELKEITTHLILSHKMIEWMELLFGEGEIDIAKIAKYELERWEATNIHIKKRQDKEWLKDYIIFWERYKEGQQLVETVRRKYAHLL